MLHDSSRSRVTNVVVIDNIPMISEPPQCPFVSPSHFVFATADSVLLL